MTARAMFGTTKSKSKNTTTINSWKITPAPKECLSGKKSINQLMRERGFDPGSKEKMLMQDMLDRNDQISFGIAKEEKKEFLKNLSEDYFFKIYPKQKKFLTQKDTACDEYTRVTLLIGDLYNKIKNPSEYWA